MKRIVLRGTFVIADPQFLITMALKEMLVEYGAKVYPVQEKEALLELLGKRRISLVIADHLQLFNGSAKELSRLKHDFPDVAHLVLTSSISKSGIRALNDAGFTNIALKSDDRAEIIHSVSMALSGNKYYSREVLDHVLHQHDHTAEALLLTPTEIELVMLISTGSSIQEIAARKKITAKSVTAHRKSIYRKLGVTNESELKQRAVQSGLIDTIEYYI
jgi:DNA-binding NarL/FixJ family response regulator